MMKMTIISKNTVSKNDVLLDCDEVLLNWNESFDRFVKDTCGLLPEEGSGFSISSRFKIDAGFARTLVKKHNNDFLYFGNLRPTEGAVEAVAALKQKGYRIHILSQCGDTEMIKNLRVNNLKNVFGNVFESITCICETSARKHDYFHKHPFQLYLDDALHHLNDAVEFENIYPVWMEREYHSDEDRDSWRGPKVKNMTEFCEVFISA